MAKKARSGFMLYHHDLDRAIRHLTSEEGWALIQALNNFSQGLQVDTSQLTAMTVYAFEDLCEKIERDAQRYEETCRRNLENINRRYQKQKDDPQHDGSEQSTTVEMDVPPLPTIIGTLNENEKENVTVSVSETGSAEPTAPFVPPTQKQVEEYARFIGKQMDCQRFRDYYASKGWVIGNAPMRDWQAALRGWVDNRLCLTLPSDHPGCVPPTPPTTPSAHSSYNDLGAQSLAQIRKAALLKT